MHYLTKLIRMMQTSSVVNTFFINFLPIFLQKSDKRFYFPHIFDCSGSYKSFFPEINYTLWQFVFPTTVWVRNTLQGETTTILPEPKWNAEQGFEKGFKEYFEKLCRLRNKKVRMLEISQIWNLGRSNSFSDSRYTFKELEPVWN